ncbi:MAG: carbon storage regulator [Oscillospiraceae bacterium]|nr:carbon storage regulator [Oscillospiraceae bacterium]
MLIITRKSGEGFHIGEGITVTVVEAGKDKVKLGIDAPRDVKIIRSEIYESGKFNVQAAVNKVSIDFMNSFLTDKPTPNKLNGIK